SARRAYTRGDAPAAVRLFGRAAALLPPESSERLKLLPALGDALTEVGVWAGDNARALAEMERAARLAAESGDRMQEQRSISGIVIALTYGSLPVDAIREKLDEIAPPVEGTMRP